MTNIQPKYMRKLFSSTLLVLLSSSLSGICGEFVNRHDLKYDDIVSFRSHKSGKYLGFDSNRKLKAQSDKDDESAKFRVKFIENGKVRLQPLGGASNHLYVFEKDQRPSYTTTAGLPSQRQSQYWIAEVTGYKDDSEVAIYSVSAQKHLRTNSSGSYTKFNTSYKYGAETVFDLYRH